MNYRKFSSLGVDVSEVGYGTWGMAGGEGGWTGSDDETALVCLYEAVRLGCNFLDTAWIYGRGHGERLIGRFFREIANDRGIVVATKVPPKNRIWPSKRGDRIEDAFPRQHICDYAHRSLENLGLERLDVLQFHVWEDAWAHSDEWRTATADLQREGLVKSIGISVNRWEPWSCLKTLEAGGIDSVQVIYNIFDQAPEDELLPLCEELGISVIARVPFDEGSLTGALSADSSWPDDDWRSRYFCPENLGPTLQRMEALRAAMQSRPPLPELALRFTLSNPAVTTVIPGMRKLEHVRANMRAGDGQGLCEDRIRVLRQHRWDRLPQWWSD